MQRRTIRSPPSSAEGQCVRIDSLLEDDEQRSLARDALEGLRRPRKQMPSKHFYDSRGSALFDQICELPEYYPTRAEREILSTHAVEIAKLTHAAELVELGAGTAAKTRALLRALDDQGALRRYVPIDVTSAVVEDCAVALSSEFPRLTVHGVICDFERHLRHLPASGSKPRLLALLGGTIGNFTPAGRVRLLREISAMLAPGDHLLLGTDLVKDPCVLEAAYNDSAGVTAEFNRNLLHVMNSALDGNFDPASFDHVAVFDEQEEWIEMRLRSKRKQTVSLGALELSVHFEEGEEMRTEISAKFTRRRVESELESAGLAIVRWFTDGEGMFALTLARPAT